MMTDFSNNNNNVVTFILPLPPSVNHLYVYQPRKGRVALAEHARVWRAEVVLTIGAARPVQPPPGARLHLTVRLYFPDHRKRDLDNALKLLFDAVAAALAFDDSQIDELHVSRGYDPAAPRAEVRLLWSAGQAGVLLWHCAWCEPPPSEYATSGICEYHLAQLVSIQQQHQQQQSRQG